MGHEATRGETVAQRQRRESAALGLGLAIGAQAAARCCVAACGHRSLTGGPIAKKAHGAMPNQHSRGLNLKQPRHCLHPSHQLSLSPSISIISKLLDLHAEPHMHMPYDVSEASEIGKNAGRGGTAGRGKVKR
jgi:hypothetical protein